MKIHEFKGAEDYKATQVKGSHYRINRRAQAMPGEIEAIVRWCHCTIGPLYKVICHGARDGTEVKLFKQYCVEVDKTTVIGTDLFNKDQENVIEWDYHNQKDEWINAFDLVYSNSLDHSHSPKECLAVWLAQLSTEGVLALIWTFAHTLESRPLPLPGGDCFGAGLHEYIKLIQEAGGEILDLLWLPVEAKNPHVAILAQRKRK